ncbi:tRNA:m4X modification enzyme, partial [Coemansia sp. RSA 1721]
KKNRYCPFATKSNSKYCGEHMVGKQSNLLDANANVPNTRVPCPYDPSHSVDLHKLKRHMAALCNARPPEIWPTYTAPDCNVALLPPGYTHDSFEEAGALWKEEGLGKADPRLMLKPGDLTYMSATSRVFSDWAPPEASTSQKHEKQPLDRQSVERLLKPVVLSYLRSVEELSAESDAEQCSLSELLIRVRCSEEFPTDVRSHSALDHKRLIKANQKHAQQQASIVGHLEKRGLLDSKYAFIEFGSGKGELSVYVHAAAVAANPDTAPDSHVYLVDRKVFRQKFKADQQDNGVQKTQDHRDSSQQLERINIDIRDFDLASLEGLRATDPLTGNPVLRPIIAYSKHLCGGATDLTLKCLERYQQAGGHIAGVAIALCCHHACRYSMYVDHEYLSTAVASHSTESSQWSHDQRSDFRHLASMTGWAINLPPPVSPGSAFEKDSEPAHYSGLSYAQRVCAGHAVKRFLDIGRVRFVRRQLGMDDAELVYYTLRTTSPENLALFATDLKD